VADEKIRIELELETDDASVRNAVGDLEGRVKRSGQGAGRAFGRSFTDGARAGLVRLGAVAAAAAASVAAVFAGREIIAAAARQEDAVNNLNASLRRIGEFSQGASQDLQNFASQLQSVTRFGDEAVLEQLAFAQGLGATAEQSKAVVAAAADLAGALNIDLNSATRNVARTLGGFAGELGEVIPELKNLSAEQLRAGAAIDLLGAKFRGIASAQIVTFSGSLKQLTNIFSDFLESIGSFVTGSPALIGAFRGISQVLSGVTASINQTAQSGDFLRGPIIALIDVFELWARNAIISTTVISRAFTALVNSIVAGGNVIAAIIGTIGEGIGRVAKLLGAGGGISESLIQFGETSRQVAGEDLAELNTQLKALGEPIDTRALTESLETIRSSINQTQEGIAPTGDGAAFGATTGEDPVQKSIEAGTSLNTLFDEIGAGFSATEAQITEGSLRISKAAIQVGQNIKRGIGQGIGAGFGAFGKALVDGENALDAFAKAFLGTLGQLMIQQGTAFILQGLGFSVIPGLQGNGATLIATGAALATFGGVLSALGGGGAGAQAGAGGGVGAVGGGPQFGDGGSLTGQTEERETQQTAVTVNVEGNVLTTDNGDLGRQIVEVINEAFDSEGVVVNGGAVS